MIVDCFYVYNFSENLTDERSRCTDIISSSQESLKMCNNNLDGCLETRGRCTDELRELKMDYDICLNSKNESILSDQNLGRFNFILYFKDNPKISAMFFRYVA